MDEAGGREVINYMKMEASLSESDLSSASIILEHQDRLLHFHVHDGSEYPAKNHLALGDGEIDIAGRLQLAEINRARCVLETKTIEALKHSIQWLKDEKYI